jgi:hypothetical protein
MMNSEAKISPKALGAVRRCLTVAAIGCVSRKFGALAAKRVLRRGGLNASGQSHSFRRDLTDIVQILLGAGIIQWDCGYGWEL